jgi:hypothetical protein
VTDRFPGLRLASDVAAFGLPLGWLPNRAGFRLLGIKHDGTTAVCMVIRDPATGMHRIAEAPVTAFRGWRDVIPVASKGA